MSHEIELDIVNDMLATLGESPLLTLDEDHPMVGACRRIIKNQSKALQDRNGGWWFNFEYVELVPDPVTKFIVYPGDALSCIPVLMSHLQRYVVRGKRFYDIVSNSYIIDTSIRCALVRHLPLEDLPFNALNTVSLRAQQRFQMTYDADRLKMQALQAELTDAQAQLNAEHIRAVRTNPLLKGSAAGKLAQIQGYGHHARLPSPGFGAR